MKWMRARTSPTKSICIRNWNQRVNEWLSIVSTWCALSRGRKLKHHTNTVYADLLQIVIKGAYKWFLWHQKICQFLFDFSITHKRRLREMLILKCLCVVLFCLKFNRIRSLRVHSSIWSSCLGVNNSITNWIIIHSSFQWSSFLSAVWAVQLTSSSFMSN